MRWVLLFRMLFRFGSFFAKGLREGNPYALAALAVIVVGVLLAGFLKFARRPLGGDPDKPSIPEDAFQDDKNPYR